MDGTANNLHVVLKKYQNSTAKRSTTSGVEFHASCQSQHLQQGHIKHPARARVTVGDRRQSGHCPCGVGCRQTGSIQHTVIFDGRSASFVVRRFKGTTLEDGAGHGQQAWTALREKFKGSSLAAIRAERSKMNPNNAFRTRPRRVPLHHGQLA